MGKPRKGADSTDRHKPSKTARVRKRLAEALARLVEANASDFTEEVNNAVREYLRARNLWPPPGEADG